MCFMDIPVIIRLDYNIMFYASIPDGDYTCFDVLVMAGFVANH